MIRIIVLLAGSIALSLAGCATPVGQIPEEDFQTARAELPLSYQAAYRNLREAFRTCPSAVAEGDLYTDIGEGRFVLYLPQTFPLAGRSDWVFGKITVAGKGDGNSTLATSVQTIYAHPHTHKLWHAWARGETRCDL